jgi:FkbM family methyltransferase
MATPLVLVDVGAAGGLKEPWRSASSSLHVVGFEPDARATLPNIGLRTTWIKTGLADRQGPVEFYETKKPDASSILRPNDDALGVFGGSERFEVVRQTTIEVDTLDHALAEQGIGRVDFLKLDTQGSELMILRGGEQAVRSALGVEVEVSVLERYYDQAFFHQVDAFLRERGFLLFDFQRRYMKRRIGLAFGGPKGQLTHGTALYLRDVDSIPAERAEQAMAVAQIYGYEDYAAEIAAKHDLPFQGKKRTNKRIHGAARLSSLFRRWAMSLNPPSSSGLSGDEMLGNR